MFSGSCGRWLVDTIAEDDINFKKPGMPCDYRWNSIIINNVTSTVTAILLLLARVKRIA